MQIVFQILIKKSWAELGRHRGREGSKECELCGNECESVSCVFWECSVYSSSRADFLL